MSYGKELILDIHNCNTPFSRTIIKQFMKALCNLINMERADLHFWDYDDEAEKEAAPPHLAGTSAVQFITTSNITIHTLDKLKAVYLNIFTCAELNSNKVAQFCSSFWQGEIVSINFLERK